jgi:hypothetical protein
MVSCELDFEVASVGKAIGRSCNRVIVNRSPPFPPCLFNTSTAHLISIQGVTFSLLLVSCQHESVTWSEPLPIEIPSIPSNPSPLPDFPDPTSTARRGASDSISTCRPS